MHESVKCDCLEPSRWRSLLTAAGSVVRSLPLFFAARPKTPLRVMCVMALDMLHRLRLGQPLPTTRRNALAALLDLGACANAALDNKECIRQEFRQTRKVLTEAGLASARIAYLRRLRKLERGRPQLNVDPGQFQAVRRYRENVVRLSLAMVATTANLYTSLDQAMRAMHDDAHLDLLFHIVMQCQIIDDVFDYHHDLAAGLPSFLTAGMSFARALEQTRWAAFVYANPHHLPVTADILPLRATLFLASACARLTLALGRWRWGHVVPQVEIVRSAHSQSTFTSAIPSSK